MRFTSLSTQNFRQYADLKLNLDVPSDFAVIQANSGQGKTTLTNAILWCLYGDEHDKFDEPIPNEFAVVDAGNGGNVFVSVHLEIEMDDGSSATIKRRQEFIIGPDGPKARNSSELVVAHLKDRARGVEIVKQPAVWVEKLLPKKLYPYFIFNGEKAAYYFETSPQQEIRETILRIARVDVLQRMKSRLQTIANEIRSEITKSDPGNIDDAQVADCRSTYEGIKEQILGLESELHNFDQNNADLRERLENSRKARELLAEEDGLDAERKSLEQQLKLGESALAQWVALQAPNYFALDAFKSMRLAIDSSIENDTYPPAFKPEPLQKLIEKGVCICGEPINEGSSALRHINEVISQYRVAGPPGVELQKIDTHLALFEEQLLVAESGYREILRTIQSVIDDIAMNDESSAELRARMSQETVKNEAEIFDQLLGLSNARGKVEGQILQKRSDLGLAEKKLEEAEREFDRLLEKSGVAGGLKKQHAYVSKAIKTLETIHEGILATVLRQVGGELNRNYSSWHSKETSEQIELDEDFHIRKVGTWNQSTSFSAGEFRLLYYALCFAARSVSGFRFPIIIDSPWGNMDNTIRRDLAEVVSRNVKNCQTVILVLDSEYTTEVASIMANAKPKHFEIQMTETSSSKYSTVSEVQ